MPTKPPKLELGNLLEIVDEPPRTGQITKKPYSRLELVDSTRIDSQHRVTRRQLGPVIPLGKARGRHVKTVAIELHYRQHRTPELKFRLDFWECRKDKQAGGAARLWYRRSYMRWSLRNVTTMVKLFGGTGGALDPRIAEAAAELKAQRLAWHARKLEAVARAEAAAKRVEAGVEEKPEPELSFDLDDLALLG